MSLGAKLIWRAAVRSPRLKELFARPPAHFAPSPLRQTPLPSRRCASTAASAGHDVRSVPQTDRTRLLVPPQQEKGPAAAPSVAALTKSATFMSPSAFRRHLLRRVIKRRDELVPHDLRSVLVRPLAERGSKRELRRSGRKYERSAARQALFAHERAQRSLNEGTKKPPPRWGWILKMLSKYTPRFGATFEFKVLVANGVTREALGALSDADTNIWQIQQKTGCIVRVEDTDVNAEGLVLTLSGSEHAVRKALNELVRATGKATAVRVLDRDSEEMFRDLVKRQENGLIGESVASPADTKTLTVERVPGSAQGLFLAPYRSKRYVLETRADEIAQPSEWTKTSFLDYVLQLVNGYVPRRLTRKIYQEGPDHQQTVVRLLVELFAMEATAPVQSAPALYAALSYIQSKGLAFRAQARTIVNQAEVNRVPINTHMCNLFLRASSKLGDLEGFEDIIKLMIRKDYTPNTATWLTFLEIVESTSGKWLILREMRRRGLSKVESALVGVGSHMAPYDMASEIVDTEQLMEFIKGRDNAYTPGWLNIMALNRLIDTLGGRERVDLCEDLLDFAYTSGRAQPDVVTLNTMLTHSHGMINKIVVLKSFHKRWFGLRPDEGTFHILFRTAWQRRSPNMLRVIFRYGSFARRLSSKTMDRFSSLLQPPREFGKPDSGKSAFLKGWKTEIFGKEVLDELRTSTGLLVPSYAQVVAKTYASQAEEWRPMLRLDLMLAVAYVLDQRIHEVLRIQKQAQSESESESGIHEPGQELGLTPDLRESLTLVIPLKPKTPPLTPRETPEG